MSIRIHTIKAMAERRRAVFRVRRRAYESLPSELDADGVEHEPDTWARWEEEYFTNYGYAFLACKADADTFKRLGYLDQVKAVRVWKMVRAAGLDTSTFEAGRYRLVPTVVVQGERIVAL